PDGSIVMAYRQYRIESATRVHLIAKPVLVALDCDISHKSVAAVGPPEPGAFVAVKRQDLARQGRSLASLNCQVAVKNVVNFGAILQEEAMANRSITDAVANY